MPRFLARDLNIIVSTSFKVMYSSFVASELAGISEADFVRYIRTNTFSHFMAARHPYARLASFFADKLRENVRRNEGEWQECQRIFFPFIGVAVGDPYDKIRDALLGMSFEEFIDCLPLVREEHLMAQCALLEVGCIDLKPCTRIFHIETDARRLWHLLGVKDPPHANRTSIRPDVFTLTRERLDIVNEIYSDDFSYLGYGKR